MSRIHHSKAQWEWESNTSSIYIGPQGKCIYKLCSSKENVYSLVPHLIQNLFGVFLRSKEMYIKAVVINWNEWRQSIEWGLKLLFHRGVLVHSKDPKKKRKDNPSHYAMLSTLGFLVHLIISCPKSPHKIILVLVQHIKKDNFIAWRTRLSCSTASLHL